LDSRLDDEVNPDDELDKLLDEAENDAEDKQERQLTPTALQTPKLDTNADEKLDLKLLQEHNQGEDQAEIVVLENWGDEEENVDEKKEMEEQDKQLSAFLVKDLPSEHIVEPKDDGPKEPIIGYQEVIEARISLLVSNMLNKFGKVIDIVNPTDLAKLQEDEQKRIIEDAPYQFHDLKPSLQRKLILMEGTIANVSELLEKTVVRKAQLRRQKKVLKVECIKRGQQIQQLKQKHEDELKEWDSRRSKWHKEKALLMAELEKNKIEVPNDIAQSKVTDDGSVTTVVTDYLSSLSTSIFNQIATATAPLPTVGEAQKPKSTTEQQVKKPEPKKEEKPDPNSAASVIDSFKGWVWGTQSPQTTPEKPKRQVKREGSAKKEVKKSSVKAPIQDAETI
jgi:hypothetical protein